MRICFGGGLGFLFVCVLGFCLFGLVWGFFKFLWGFNVWVVLFQGFFVLKAYYNLV